MTRAWSPAIYDHGDPLARRFGELPQPGQIIAYFRSRKAWRVLVHEDIHQANWRPQTTTAWEKAGSPDWETWKGREVGVMVEPARNPQPNGKDRRGLRFFPWAHQEQWWPLPDPYPACVDCGLLWPCPCHERNLEARKAMAEFDRLAAILPGCCWNCGNPVERRQHSIVFDGDNLLMPGAGPVVFHTSGSRFYESRTGKRSCRQAAVAYEKRWVDAGPGRKVRLHCPGRWWRHYQWGECTAGNACPGEQADHGDYSHCSAYVGVWVDGAATCVVPVSSCGGKGCRGPKVPADVNVEEAQDA